MEKLQIFENVEFETLRTLEIEGKNYFVVPIKTLKEIAAMFS